MKTAFTHWILTACSCYCVHWDHKLFNMISPVTLWNQYVNNRFSMHVSAQQVPAIFMRHTIAAQVPHAILSPSSEIIHSCCSWTAKGFSPSLWSLPYSISLIKSRDHGGWVLRHESDNEVKHIMQILILQRGKRRKKEKSLNCSKSKSVKLFAGCILNIGDTHLLKYWLKDENRPCFCSTMQQNLNIMDHLTWSRDTYLMYC